MFVSTGPCSVLLSFPSRQPAWWHHYQVGAGGGRDREKRIWEGGRGRWRREERDLENGERGWGRWEERAQREQGSLTGRHSR